MSVGTDTKTKTVSPAEICCETSKTSLNIVKDVFQPKTAVKTAKVVIDSVSRFLSDATKTVPHVAKTIKTAAKLNTGLTAINAFFNLVFEVPGSTIKLALTIINPKKAITNEAKNGNTGLFINGLNASYDPEAPSVTNKDPINSEGHFQIIESKETAAKISLIAQRILDTFIALLFAGVAINDIIWFLSFNKIIKGSFQVVTIISAALLTTGGLLSSGKNILELNQKIQQLKAIDSYHTLEEKKEILKMEIAKACFSFIKNMTLAFVGIVLIVANILKIMDNRYITGALLINAIISLLATVADGFLKGFAKVKDDKFKVKYEKAQSAILSKLQAG